MQHKTLGVICLGMAVLGVAFWLGTQVGSRKPSREDSATVYIQGKKYLSIDVNGDGRNELMSEDPSWTITSDGNS